MDILKTREVINCRCLPEDKGIYRGYSARAHQYIGDLSGPDPCCIYNKKLYYEFMDKYKNGEKFDLQEENKEKLISIKEAG